MLGKNPEKSLAARTGIVRQRQAASRKPQSVANAEPTGRRSALKVPEALPVEQRVKESPLKKFTSAVFRKKVTIQEIVREPTSGGIVFRLTPDKKDVEILLIQDSKGRWTIPKGHIEPGETAKMTARREIEEETGLTDMASDGDAMDMDMDMMEEFPEEDMATSPDALIDESFDGSDMDDQGMTDIEDNGDMPLGGDDTDVDGVDMDDSEDTDDSEDIDDSEDDFDLE